MRWVAIALLFPSVVLADFVEVRRNANVYAEPRTSSDVIARFEVTDASSIVRLTVVEDDLRNGYHSVALPDQSVSGWIYKTRVRRFPGELAAEGLSSESFFGGLPDTSGLEDWVTQVENIGYSAGYSEAKWNPLWVAYELPVEQDFDCPRLTRFQVDDRTDAEVTHDDYTSSGYDRGHMAPSHNIGSRYDCEAQDETYLMSNIAPQRPVLNQRPWGGFERLVSSVYAPTFGGVSVITGPIFDPEQMFQLCSGVEIPVAFYKIVVEGRNQEMPSVLAIVMEQDTRPGVLVSDLLVTVDEIEARTGLDFFPELDDSIEEAIEAARASDSEWALETRLDTNFRPRARDECVLDPILRSEYDYDQ